MRRTSPSLPKSPQRAFGIQAALILGPMVLLTVLALAGLRSDRQEVERRAYAQAQAAAPVLARAIQESWVEGLSHYAQARREVFPDAALPQPISPISVLARGPRPPALARPAGVDSLGWVMPNAEFSASGTLLSPPPFSASPSPPTWWIELDPKRRERWDTARHLELTNAPLPQLVAAYEACRDPVTDAFFDLNVLFALRRLGAMTVSPTEAVDSLTSFSANPRLLTPAGVPLAGLVVHEALARSPSGALSPNLLRRLEASVSEFPSVLTPQLLDRARQVLGAAGGSNLVRLERLETRWRADQRWRSWAPSLASRDNFQSSPRWIGESTNAAPLLPYPFTRSLAPSLAPRDNFLPSPRWIGESTNAALLLPYPFTQIYETAGERTTNAMVAVSVIPIAALEVLTQAAIANRASLIPAFASAEVSWVGRSFAPIPPSGAPTLARVELPLESGLPYALPFELRLLLTHPEALYRAQRQRELWMGGLILGAVLAAAVGLWQAGRSLQRQVALNEQKSNFVSAVSHELRGPLASLQLLAEGLADRSVTDDSRRREYAGFLVEESRRLGALVENVLNFARLEEGRMRYEFGPTDARRLVRESAARFESAAAARQVSLHVELPPPEHVLEPNWDGMAIQQALSNLLDNALKHAPEGSVVRVCLEVMPGATPALGLSVTDQGPGIPKEDHERIFERFYRRGSELRRDTKGVGLGLALVRHWVQAHRGRVTVISDVQQGATFRLELPYDPLASANSPRP